MSADPVDIARATRAAQVVTLADATIRAQFPAARDALVAPDAGFFVDAADAAAALAIKATLVGTFRRRFLVPLASELEIDPLIAIPTGHLRDPELGVDTMVLVTRVQLDLDTEYTTLEVIG